MTSSLTPTAAASDALGDGAIATPRSELDVTERAELFALLDRYFQGVSAEQFARDLDEKDWVLRIRREGRLVGFSTLQVLSASHDGRAVNVIYSGDTIMAPEAWGSPVLARSWIALVRRIQASRAGEPWYWLLLSSGFRTYRFLPVFWREFWPRHDAETPSAVTAMLGALARQRFGDQFDAQAGVVRFAHPQRLRRELAALPEGKDVDPHVHFFATQNPGHTEGDELVCLTELSDANLTAAGERMVRQTRRA